MWNWHHHGFPSFSVNNSFIKLSWWSSTAIAFSEEVTFNLYLFLLSHDIRSILAEECPIPSQPRQADSPLRHIALIKVLVILRVKLSSITALICSKNLWTGVINHVRCLLVIYTLVSVMKCSGISKGLLTIPLISEESLTLVSHSLHQALSLDRAQVRLELLTLNELRCLTHQVVLAFVVLAWRKKCAFWAPIVVKHVTLQVDGWIFKLFKPFILEKLPHFFLCNFVSFFYQFSFILIKDYWSAHVANFLFLSSKNMVKLDDSVRAIRTS